MPRRRRRKGIPIYRFNHDILNKAYRQTRRLAPLGLRCHGNLVLLPAHTGDQHEARSDEAGVEKALPSSQHSAAASGALDLHLDVLGPGKDALGVDDDLLPGLEDLEDERRRRKQG